MEENRNTYKALSSIQLNEYTGEKNGFTYLAWSVAWGKVLEYDPKATYKVYEQIMDERGNTRPWFDDGKSGWTKVGVTIDGVERVETLAIMSLSNKALPVEQIDSVSANKSVKRCFVKAIAMHGLGLYIYNGDDEPEAITKLEDIKAECFEIAKKKSALSDKAKETCVNLFAEAERNAFPEKGEDKLTGKIDRIENYEVLESLRDRLLAVRK